MQEQTIIIADDHPLFRDALRQAVIGMINTILKRHTPWSEPQQHGC